MEPNVSIVVPIYNVEKYLNQCIDSLLKQTLEDIEIILVDDGSPDRCGKIADSYAQKDRRVKVIHQENAGLGPARNSGMRLATGEYIGFVDSDDWVKPEMFERLYNEAVRTGADIVVGGHCEFSGNKLTEKYTHPLAGITLCNARDILEIRKNLYARGVEDKSTKAFPMSVCSSIYRKEMLVGYKLTFPNILSEDRIFNLFAYKYARIISFSDHTDYFYRKEGQVSITQTFSERKREQFQKLMIDVMEMAEREEDTDCVLRAKRMTIDYCRSYVAVVDRSDLNFCNKVKQLKILFDREEIAQCWDGYPIEKLPLQQYLFHQTIIKRWYGLTLILNRFRQKLRKIYK